jgi:hypothetical protein
MITFLSFVLISGAAYATETPEFKEFEDPEQEFEEAEKKLSAEFGGVWATGNTVFFNVNASVDGSFKWKKNKLGTNAVVTVGRGLVDTDGDGALSDPERFVPWTETAKRATLGGRYDRFFGKKNSIYALVNGVADPFVGYKLRTNEQLGYSRILYQTEDATEIVAEIGMDFAQENYIDGVDPGSANVLAARAMVGISHTFGENANISESLEVFENVLTPIDLRLINELAVTAKVTNAVALKLSHEFRFDNEPVSGFVPADQQSLATIVVTIL